VKVTPTGTSDEEPGHDYPEGDAWSVTDGVLTVVDSVGNLVAGYPAGSWANVVRHQ
jgi:hypothetical protein